MPIGLADPTAPWGKVVRRPETLPGAGIRATKARLSAKLVAESEAHDQGFVPLRAAALQVFQQLAALGNHVEQTTPGVVVLLVSLEMFRQVGDLSLDELRERSDATQRSGLRRLRRRGGRSPPG